MGESAGRLPSATVHIWQKYDLFGTRDIKAKLGGGKDDNLKFYLQCGA